MGTYPVSERVAAEKGWGASKCIRTRRGGPRRMCEVVAGAGAREGYVGCIWDGGGTSRRGGARQNASGHIEGGRGVCMRSWLGLGHMEGMWDACGMVAAC